MSGDELAESMNDNSEIVYDEKEDKIILIYTGKITDQEIMEGISHKLPQYMYPNKMIQLKVMPLNQNGKIDRKWLKNHYHEEEK